VGDLFTVTITVLDEDGDPVDLSGYDAELEIATPTPINQAGVVGGANGVITFTLAPAITEGIHEGKYSYGIQYSKTIAGPTVVDRKELFHGDFNLVAERVT
jgi:hypothetical protein